MIHDRFLASIPRLKNNDYVTKNIDTLKVIDTYHLPTCLGLRVHTSPDNLGSNVLLVIS